MEKSAHLTERGGPKWTHLSYASIIVNWSERSRRILSSMDGLNGAILSSEFRPRSARSAPWARRVAIAVGIRSTPRNVPDIRDWKGAIRARKCSKEQWVEAYAL